MRWMMKIRAMKRRMTKELDTAIMTAVTACTVGPRSAMTPLHRLNSEMKVWNVLHVLLFESTSKRASGSGSPIYCGVRFSVLWRRPN